MRLVCAIVTFAATLGVASSAGAADQATAAVSVSVQVSSRTSLHVSSHVLRFAVGADSGTATDVIDFSAAARVPAASDLVLSVEPTHGVDGPGGAADVDTGIVFSGVGEGLTAGALDPARSAVAGRWKGSGVRAGRLTFTLQASASGFYLVPVSFVLSTP